MYSIWGWLRSYIGTSHGISADIRSCVSRAYATDICRYPRALATDITILQQVVGLAMRLSCLVSNEVRLECVKWHRTDGDCAR